MKLVLNLIAGILAGLLLGLYAPKTEKHEHTGPDGNPIALLVGRLEPEVADNAIAAGQCDFVAMARKMLADPEQVPAAEAVTIVFPTFEGGGTHLNISGVAMTKSAPNKDAAKKFMEFYLKPEIAALNVSQQFNGGHFPIELDNALHV